MRVLVTGASGFIGSYLVAELQRRGCTVTALARPTSDTTFLRQRGVSIAVGDITDRSSLAPSVSGQDAILHLAAVVGKNPGGWEHHVAVGVQGTRNIIDAATASGVSRFIHLSSCSIYRCPPAIRVSEETPFDEHPESWNHYVRQKVLSEQLVWQAHSENRIRATSLRPSTVLGPGDPNLVPRMQAIMSSPLGAIADDGQSHFPVVVVDELVVAMAEAVMSDVAVGNAYNLSGRDPITKDRLLHYFKVAGLEPIERSVGSRAAIQAAAIVARALESPSRLRGRRARPFTTRVAVKLLERYAQRRSQPDCIIDCSRATADLHWRGTADYVDAIQRTMSWCQT